MAGLNTALGIGRNALLMRQQQMSVTGNNVANADRPGFHRQQAVVVNSTPHDMLTGQLGTGAKVQEVMRAYDQALEDSLRQARHEHGRDEALVAQLTRIEGLLAPNGESPLATAISHFANSLQDASADPQSNEKRIALLASAEELADWFNRSHDDVAGLQNTLFDSTGAGTIASTVDEVNRLGSEIAQLNRHITASESRLFNAHPANDLRDRRDELLTELANLTDFQLSSNPDGSYVVAIDGRALVDGETANTISVATVNDAPAVQWANDQSTVGLQNGRLFGELQAWTDTAARRQGLVTFADTFTAAVNTSHALGFDHTGTQGTALFTGQPGNGGVAIAISSAEQLAIASGNAGGDGNNAHAIWQVLHQPQATLGNNDMASYADTLVNQLASDTAEAATRADNAMATVNMFAASVGQHSGVSVDEEMMQMLEIQRAYQASAKFVSVVDEMLATALSQL